MKEVVIDTSEDHVGVVIADGLIISMLKDALRLKFGRSVHMKKLQVGEKFSVLRTFDKIFREKGFTGKTVEIFSINVDINNSRFWNSLVVELLDMGIRTLNADYEVLERLNKFVNALYLRRLDIYPPTETLQLADIVAYSDSHYDFVKNIWRNVPIQRGGFRVK
jgi:hypothetical protein